MFNTKKQPVEVNKSQIITTLWIRFLMIFFIIQWVSSKASESFFYIFEPCQQPCRFRIMTFFSIVKYVMVQKVTFKIKFSVSPLVVFFPQ